MNDNPFKIIRTTEQPPENLRKEVVGSARTVILMMRFLQLFLADQVNVLFEHVRLLKPGKDDDRSSTERS